ncbi:MAG: hypothetical protein VKL60_02615 [Sphaerospermopsis sp.]|nr:hypothetical protein [Sphaerospermopsis sp.]
MISGKFGDEDELFFEIELMAADGLELPVEALLVILTRPLIIPSRRINSPLELPPL